VNPTTSNHTSLPADFDIACDEAWRRMVEAPGFLSEREGRFLALAAAASPAEGTILEIGSFKGKSTVGLAAIAKHYGMPPIVAVDPFTAPSRTDPSLQGAESSYGEFVRTVRGAGVEEHVEVHQARSSDLAPSWNRPLRFLWIDGDHTYAGTKADLDMYRPHLADGAIVAMHDALHLFDGPVRVFVEEVLSSNDFGPAGFCGSIAWAQYRPKDGGCTRFARKKASLSRAARRLIPFVKSPTPPNGIRRIRYKLLRYLVPHGRVNPESWAALVSH
jgi:predicted O-methyltransferase YrrM